jgi:hypothetical protein
MDNTTFKERFLDYENILKNGDSYYRRAEIWSNVGNRSLDEKLSELADLYWDSTQTQQKLIRDAVNPSRTWELIVYIRRIAMLIVSQSDGNWLRRGLAVAAIENSSFDYRDLIVSLVILRYAAEQAGIKTRQYFNDTMKISDPIIHDVLRNARDHSESCVTQTIHAFGPPQWKVVKHK